MLLPLALFASLLGVAQAGVIFDNTDYAMHPDIPFEIKWVNNRGPVNISLQNGPDADLKLVLIIKELAEGNSYMWTPPTTLKKDGYELVIQDGVSTDWSQRFQYPAPSIASSTTDSSSATSSATTFSTTTAPPTAILTTTATATVTTDTAANATATGTPTPTAIPTTDTGLSAGAKAGLGVGITLGVLALIGLAGFFFYRRRAAASRRNNAAAASLDRHGAAPTPFAELGDFDVKELAGAGTPSAWGGKAYEPTHTHMGYSDLDSAGGGRRDINTSWSNCSKCAAGSTPVPAYTAPYHAAEVAELSSEPRPYR
ncbi:hypothetical protein B0T19DRAFT_429672 [Cercophora scortea]|uniref:Uncharacterized protein n=1 Tax=Cercophora scortea TaxID=314031 RepID=A0AAE0I8H3_9PEZI|nr:hypothetical protein B0T19DRAFT_429672 [Cercophora scortea]